MKGENSLKLFGDDIDTLVAKAGEIRDVMAQVPGVADLGVFQESGQPELLISINRAASARYGLMAADVDAAVQAAIGGLAATQILRGRPPLRFRGPLPAAISHARRRPFATFCCRRRTETTFRSGKWPMFRCAKGAFMIYRENGRRYIPVKFSVRGRDLAGTIQDVQQRLAQKVHLAGGLPPRMGGRVRQPAERTAPAGRHHSDQPC